MIGKTYTIPVQTSADGESFIEFPQEMIESVGWKEGDTIDWKDNEDGTYTLTKIEKIEKEETVWVLVEAVSTFRQRYMVEMPATHPEYALDTVVMQEAKEFSQEHLGEQIFSHRVISREDALKMCGEDNDYAKTWSAEKKIDVFFTTLEDQDLR